MIFLDINRQIRQVCPDNGYPDLLLWYSTVLAVNSGKFAYYPNYHVKYTW